jgi:hypothetical protein
MDIRTNLQIFELQNQKLKYLWMGRRQRLILELRKRLGFLGVIDRVHLDLFPYPQYAYGVYIACLQANMLGVRRTTVMEFGVAGGNGLIALESAADFIGRELGISVQVIGFDTGEGMPPSDDYRDIVYWYRPGDYRMDVERLKARLRGARLVIGDIRETVEHALSGGDGPVGFCSLDMDYYSATTAALKLFDAPSETRQPRVVIYADDIFGLHDLNLMCEDVGEERAFREFNDTHPRQRILPIRGLRYKRPFPAKWNDMMFVHHDFAHPDYNTPINPAAPATKTSWTALRS